MPEDDAPNEPIPAAGAEERDQARASAKAGAERKVEEEASSLWVNIGDRLTIFLLCLIFLAVVASFFFFIYYQGLTTFPDGRIGKALADKSYDYFAYALEYRERRLTLALALRTFVTSLGFIVGIVLSVIGGIFILRRALIEFTASNGGQERAQGAEAAAENGLAGGIGEANSRNLLSNVLRGVSFSLGTNSPGIVFMIGGVVVIYLTQLFAIPVGAPEIFPTNAAIYCDPTQSNVDSCYMPNRDAASTTTTSTNNMEVLTTYCATRSDESGCKAIRELVIQLGLKEEKSK